MGENVTVETTLDRSKATGVAIGDGGGDDGGNPRWVSPLVLPALARYWPKAGDRGGDFEVRGGATVAGGDGNEEHPRRLFPSSPRSNAHGIDQDPLVRPPSNPQPARPTRIHG
jgi:hypothetical protein